MITTEPVAASRPSFGARVGCLVVTLVVTLVVAECVLRAVGIASRDVNPTDPRTGLRVYPANQEIAFRTACFQNVIRTNSAGFHAREYTLEKPEGVFRVVILGDSYVTAAEVDRDRTFAARLEDLLNEDSTSTRFEIIPVGMPGNGTLANLQYLAAYGVAYHPDLVINLYNINDAENDASIDALPDRIAAIVHGSLSAPVTSVPARSGDVTPLTAWVKTLAKKSSLVVTIYTAYLNMTARTNASPPDALSITVGTMYLTELLPAIQDAWDRQEQLFAALRDVAMHTGADFWLVSLTADSRVNNVHYDASRAQFPDNVRTDPFAMEARLGQSAERLGVSYLPTVEEFSTLRNASTSAAWPCDGHYNEAGNQYMAQILFEPVRRAAAEMTSL